jgi:hypothetical protein
MFFGEKMKQNEKCLELPDFARKMTKKTLKNQPPHFFSLVFCDLNPPSKFQNPTITPSCRKVAGAEREKKER